MNPKDEKLAERTAKLVGPRHRTAAEREAAIRDYLLDEIDEDDPRLSAITARALELLGAAPPPPAPKAQQRSGGPHGGGRTPQLKDRPDWDPSLVTAPFRFVKLSDQVTPAQAATGDRSPRAGGLSGRIRVEWAFETPLLIGAPVPGHADQSQPLSLGRTGPWAIPGATLRGAVRAAVEILARGRLTQVNAHHTYGVRDFTHPLFAEGTGEGAKRLQWPVLGAAWLRPAREGDPTKEPGDSDYILEPVEKRIVRIRALPAKLNGGQPTDNGTFHAKWLNTELGKRYEAAGYVAERRGSTVVLDFESAPKMRFGTDPDAPLGDPTASDHVVPQERGALDGWLVFSNKSPSMKDVTAASLDEQQRNPRAGNQKKREYVFLDHPAGQPVRLIQEAFEAFELINSKPSRNARKPDGSWAVMKPTLEAGRRIPVFFAGNLAAQHDGFAIGLTRLFKIPHRNSVKAVLERPPGKHGTADLQRTKAHDFVETLFGYVYERPDLGFVPTDNVSPHEVARKGRVAFGFATLPRAKARVGTEVSTVAMAPRASYAPFYLAGQVKDWTDEQAGVKPQTVRLAGRKRFFPRFPRESLNGADKAIRDTLAGWHGNDNSETRSRLSFLEPAGAAELVFSGDILLDDVTPEELGALLFALTFGGDPKKPYRHMIGRAKTAGAGQARVKSIELQLDTHDDEGRALLRGPAAWEKPGPAAEGWVTAQSHSMAPFLLAFDNMMCTADPGWAESDDLREFVGAADPKEGAKIVASGGAGYGTLKAFGELRKRVKADVKMKPPAPEVPPRLLAAKPIPPLLPYRDV